MSSTLQVLQSLGRALDDLQIALCVFDMSDRALQWNHQFLVYFPEHEGHIHAGEPYADNLKRFYASRLGRAEVALVNSYVDEGIARHRRQTRAYEFAHRGMQLKVIASQFAPGYRVRIWRRAGAPETVVPSHGRQARQLRDVAPAALECLPDGMLVVDSEGRSLWANAQFRAMYGVSPMRPVEGVTFGEIYEAAWQGHSDLGAFELARSHLTEHQRFVGAPFELPLPGDRWVWVLEQWTDLMGGTTLSSHVDITAFKRQQRDLLTDQARLIDLATTDGLTGLKNRQWFDQRLEDEWCRGQRKGDPLSLLLIEIDHFKRVNDQFGHLAGDGILRGLGTVLKQACKRSTDAACRFGGEEFAVLLPYTDCAQACAMAEAIRINAACAGCALAGAQGDRITVSIGLVTATGNDFRGRANTMVAAADTALYEAKHRGRDRVVVSVGPGASMGPGAAGSP